MASEAWQKIIAEFDGKHFLNDELKPFVQAAAKDEKLGKLHPYSTHTALGLSKVDKWPFTAGMPFIIFKDGKIHACNAQNKILASGSVEELIEFVKAGLQEKDAV